MVSEAQNLYHNDSNTGSRPRSKAELNKLGLKKTDHDPDGQFPGPLRWLGLTSKSLSYNPDTDSTTVQPKTIAEEEQKHIIDGT